MSVALSLLLFVFPYSFKKYFLKSVLDRCFINKHIIFIIHVIIINERWVLGAIFPESSCVLQPKNTENEPEK